MKKLVLSLLFLLTIVTALIPYDTAPLEITTGVVSSFHHFYGFEAYNHKYLIRSEKELEIFHEYMREEVMTEDIDFEKYSLAIIPHQFTYGEHCTNCDSVVIDGNNLTLSYKIEGGLGTQIIIYSSSYPYALIPNSMLTEENYAGWVAPSNADTNEYIRRYVTAECSYSREALLKAVEICSEYKFYHLNCFIEFYSETGESKILLSAESYNSDKSFQQAVSELKELGYGNEWKGTQQVTASEIQIPDSLVLNASSYAEVSVEYENGDDAAKAMEHLKSFEGETLYEDLLLSHMGYSAPNACRRWEIGGENINSIIDTYEYICTLPDIPVKPVNTEVSVHFEYVSE